MYFLNNKIVLLFCFGLLFILGSCNSFFKEEVKKESLARVGDSYLYKEDISGVIPAELSDKDSVAFLSLIHI